MTYMSALTENQLVYRTSLKLHLDNLLQQGGGESPIIDNILLSQTMLIPDAVLREQRLGQLADNYPGTDGGIQA